MKRRREKKRGKEAATKGEEEEGKGKKRKAEDGKAVEGESKEAEKKEVKEGSEPAVKVEEVSSRAFTSYLSLLTRFKSVATTQRADSQTASLQIYSS